MECVNIEKNLDNCTCSYNCDIRGNCCECIKSHRAKRQLPGCFFPEEAEKTYDRSFEHFARLVKDGLA